MNTTQPSRHPHPPLLPLQFGALLFLVLMLIPILVSPLGTKPALGDLPPEPLAIGRNGTQPVLSLPRAPIPAVGGSHYRLRIESSDDLTSWHPAGELSPDPQGRLRWPTSPDGAQRFFRLVPELETLPGPVDGSEIFGFARILDEESTRVGWLTPQAFADQANHRFDYLPTIGFDPRTAKFWTEFNADPAQVNLGKQRTDPGYRLTDFRLSESELDLFLKNGFVVSERLGSTTFANVFYSLFSDDLPVFISADCALHAWHLTYQRMLAELEETQLAPQLGGILDGMANALARTPPQVRQGPLQENLQDADYFLSVARSLLAGTNAPAGVPPVLGPHPRIQDTLDAIKELRLYAAPPGFEMFGAGRLIDFSQFKTRGHYLRSQQLGNYFKAYLWTSRADLRVLDPAQPEQAQRELATATVLSLLLRQSTTPFGNSPATQSGISSWHSLDHVIRLFVGRSDAMNFAQLDPLLTAAGITSLESITNSTQIADLQQAILRGNLGVQLYAGDVHASPFGPDQAQLPRSFVFTGQRFVPDSWALAQVTFDRIPWFEEIPDVTWFKKILRRVPTSLDVAYSVLGNRQVGPELAERMLTPRTPGNFRDGFPYAHRLAALAATFDRFDADAWNDTLYTRWLAALRELASPTTNPEFPQAMRTRAWAHHSLNTQLASYTELKHDTLLYGKQAYASSILCEYPAGFVEPIPAFWRRMRELAEATEAGLRQLGTINAVITIDSAPDPTSFGWARSYPVPLPERHQRRLEACLHFASVMRTLETLASKELRQEPFTTTEIDFIRGLMNRTTDGYGGAVYNGWYPRLFYNDYALEMGTIDENGSNKYDALVADVFTAPPDQADPTGGVLHLATGAIDLLLVAVDNGPDRMIYAGPVMSHYEFLEPGPTLNRLTNDEWQQRLATRRPSRPDWTRDHLVPRP